MEQSDGDLFFSLEKFKTASKLKVLELMYEERRRVCKAYSIPEDTPSRPAEDIIADTNR